MVTMLGVDAVIRLVMIEKRVAQKWLEGEAVQPDTPNTLPKTGSPASPTECPEFSDKSNTMRGNSNETANKARPSSQFLHHQIPPTVRLLLSFRMFVGLAGGLLQSSLNVAFDSTLPLVVNAVFGWSRLDRA